LSGALRLRGHDITILAPFRSGASVGDVVRVGRTVPLPANGSVAPLSFGPVAARSVRRALDELHPDVIHVHEPLIPSTSMLAVLGAKAPVVGTFHAAAESSFGYRVAKPVLERVLEKIAVRTAVSDSARALVRRYFPGEYVLTPNGVDTARFANATPADLGPGQDLGSGQTVLFFGRLERRKGLEVLIQAMARLGPEQTGSEKAKLVVGGSGPEERACRALARNLGVDATFLGRMADQDVPGLYRAADVYCAPGLGGESFGIVLVEAMAAGTPVVCSELDGFKAVAGGAARFVPPGDAGLLADALRDVLEDEDARALMIKSGERLAGAFDWRRLVGGVEAIYERATLRVR
jgi:phosphatidylinositol alpha-mannosyltransferase